MSFDLLTDWSTWLEIIGTITGILCVYLQTKEKIGAWIYGIISVTLLAILFYQNNLVSDFILHIIYLLLNIYGWWTWRQYRDQAQHDHKTLSLVVSQWVMICIIMLLVTPLWGFLMLRFFNADFAYFDAFTTVGSLVAQYLLAKKYIENWIIWIIVDVVAITIYLAKELYLVAFLFLIYLILSFIGYYKWKNKDRSNHARHIDPLLVD